MKRKAIAMLMIASMTVALFVGCGSKSDESDSGKVKLTFLINIRKTNIKDILKKQSQILKKKIQILKLNMKYQ